LVYISGDNAKKIDEKIPEGYNRNERYLQEELKHSFVIVDKEI
jgi:hypothetical protein